MNALSRRSAIAAVIGAVLIAAVAAMIIRLRENEQSTAWKFKEETLVAAGLKSEDGDKAAEEAEAQKNRPGIGIGNAGGEAAELFTAISQFHEQRTAPGIVAPGAYGAAFAKLSGLTTVGGAWQSVTRVPYNVDDPTFRDYPSNSGGGDSFATGRVTGLAADRSGHVYAAGANGGVWRSSTGGGKWTPIADALPSLSSGDLQLDTAGRLWYATGEANTGATSYVGSGVYMLSSPTSGTFTSSTRVGGIELESTTINALRFTKDGTRVWAATSSGIWWHATSTRSGAWTRAFAPNPDYLAGGAKANEATAPYKNIVNDIALDPKNTKRIVAAIGWRSGDTYNGFYETLDGGATWKISNPGGAINPKDIGNVSFAFAADGSKLYAINQSPSLLNKATGNTSSYLDGIYVSNNGSVAGPWNKIADSTKLASSGSALKQAIGGKGYGPGIQAWYNQLLAVDPGNPNHVIAGLEEVYETTNGGSSWTTIGPYWNFAFSCWRLDAVYPGPLGTAPAANGCPLTTHADQHAVAVGSTSGGALQLFIGDDGGVFRRPLSGKLDTLGHAADWVSLNDGTMDALQYYGLDVGKPNAAKLASLNTTKTVPFSASGGVMVSGGLQDNGGSITQVGSGKMSSNFGGDGGDVLVDPNDGCNIVQEYVVLAMSLTRQCAITPPDPNGFLDPTKANTIDIAPPDVNARFIAPFGANDANINEWLAGGHSVWFQSKGFNITGPSGWSSVHTWPGTGAAVTTAIGFNGDSSSTNGAVAFAGWCGPCNNAGFTRGGAVGELKGSTWTWTDLDLGAMGIPNRYIGGAAVGDDGAIYVAVSGFSRRWTEGPGAGDNHIFKLTKSAGAWTATALDGTTFPDLPVSSIKVLPDNALLVGTDFGMVYKAAGSTTWQRLGSGLPLTVVTDVVVGPDGMYYVSTHGRGIWKMAPIVS